MNDPTTPALSMVVIPHAVEAVVFLVSVHPNDVITHVTLSRDQAVETIELLVAAIATIDVRESERTTLNTLFQQSESPEHDHTDQP
jgi:hypothetical protein